MPRTTKELVRAAVDVARFTQAEMAKTGEVHKTTLSRYVSGESELEPSPVWTVRFLGQLVSELEARSRQLAELQAEAAEVWQATPEFHIWQSMAQHMKDLLSGNYHTIESENDPETGELHQTISEGGKKIKEITHKKGEWPPPHIDGTLENTDSEPKRKPKRKGGKASKRGKKKQS